MYKRQGFSPIQFILHVLYLQIIYRDETRWEGSSFFLPLRRCFDHLVAIIHVSMNCHCWYLFDADLRTTKSSYSVTEILFLHLKKYFTRLGGKYLSNSLFRLLLLIHYIFFAFISSLLPLLFSVYNKYADFRAFLSTIVYKTLEFSDTPFFVTRSVIFFFPLLRDNRPYEKAKFASGALYFSFRLSSVFFFHFT